MSEFFAGAIGGISGLIVGYPLDTIKTMVQSSNTTLKFNDCKNYVLKARKVDGFFTGLTIPVLSYSAIGVCSFGLYNYANNYVDNDAQHPYQFSILFGALAGAAQLIPGTPSEVIKLKLQCKAADAFKPYPKQVIRDIYRADGLRGFYKGLPAHALRDIPGFAVYFSSFTYLQENFNKENSIWVTLAAGSSAGVASWIVTFPFDVVKTRQQTGQNQTMMDAFRFMYRKGMKSFGKGLHIAILRSIIVDGSMFAVNKIVLESFEKE